MKFIILLILILMSKFAISADIQIGSTTSGNVSQQTGGNYIYAENGKLTFNFEPSLFQGRTWKYDSSVDGAVVAFETNMPIKTKNSSSFHGYEVAANGEITLVAYYDESVPTPMLIKPVYRQGYEGRTVHVWLPQAAGWVVRVVGKVARNVLPPIISKCLSNSRCASFAVSVAGHLCAFNWAWSEKGGFLREIGFPKGVCERAQDDGWHKDENGQYVRDKQYAFTATIKYGKQFNEFVSEISDAAQPPKRIGADSYEEMVSKLKSECNSMVGKHYNEMSYPDDVGIGDDYGTVNRVQFTESNRENFSCIVYFIDENDDNDGAGDELQADMFSWTTDIDDGASIKETLQFVDLETYVSEDFKDNPNPYINDTGEVGKEIREKIQSSAAIMKKDGSSGNLALTSEPYKNPETGETQQDLLSISSGTSTWSVPDNGNSQNGSGSGGSGGSSSGSGSSGSGSVPQGSNGVTVNTINRPDLSDSAKPADNNSPNGTRSPSSGAGSNGTNSGGGSANGSPNGSEDGKEKGGLNCSGEHKGTLACAGIGEVNEKAFDGIEIPTKSDNTTYSADDFLPNNGICPAPKVFHVVGKEYQVSYEPLCNIATQIRFAVLISFAVMAAMIAFGGLKKG